jgi:hypothetical protein
MPPPFPCPIATGDPLGPFPDCSQVNLSYLFKSKFKLLNMSQSFLLQGFLSSQAPIMSWGGSPAAEQPSMLLPPPPIGFWLPQGEASSARCLPVSFLVPLHHSRVGVTSHCQCHGHVHMEGKHIYLLECLCG